MNKTLLTSLLAISCNVSAFELPNTPTMPDEIKWMLEFSGHTYQNKHRIINTRKIIFWRALANDTARCYVWSAPPKLATPPSGQGFYSEIWELRSVGGSLNEARCYEQ